MTFTLPSISSSLEFWSVNHTSIYENSELVVLKNVTFFGEISSDWTNYLLFYTRHFNLINICCW